MITTKTTTHKFTTHGGSEIVCTITRTYGAKHIEAHEETVWLDQPVIINRPAKDELIDEYTINVSVNGKDFGEFRYGRDLRHPESEGRFNGLERIEGRRRTVLALDAEDDEIIHSLITERLTEDLSDYDKASIEEVKRALANGAALPLAELNARRKEYRDGMLEGGGGFNPYFYYISREFADKIIKRFPKYFK